MNNLSEKLARSYEAAEKSPSQQVESADQASAVQDLRKMTFGDVKERFAVVWANFTGN